MRAIGTNKHIIPRPIMRLALRFMFRVRTREALWSLTHIRATCRAINHER